MTTLTQEVENTPSMIWHTDHFWTSPETNLISKAMVEFHKKNLKVEKKGTVKVTATVSRKYIKLDDIMDVVRPALAEVDCYIEQHLAGDSVITRIVHSSGQFIASKFHYQTWDTSHVNNLQKLGGGLTYLKRYAVSAICNIVADEDADGNDSDNMGYKEPEKNAAASTAAVVPSEVVVPTPEAAKAEKEWLNVRTKTGAFTTIGEAAVKFIRAGGALTEIQKKYRINKENLAFLQDIERRVKEDNVPTELENQTHQTPTE